MKLSEAKMISQTGGLSGAKIYRTAGGKKWQLEFTTKRPVDFKLSLETERGSIRNFKNIDTAINIAEDIGIPEVKVILKS